MVMCHQLNKNVTSLAQSTRQLMRERVGRTHSVAGTAWREYRGRKSVAGKAGHEERGVAGRAQGST